MPNDQSGIDRMMVIAGRNRVLLRTSDALDRLGLGAGSVVQEATATEKRRRDSIVNLMERLASRCQRLGVSWLFPNAFSGWPDVGGDIDMLVLSNRHADDDILKECSIVARSGPLGELISGATRYVIASGPAPVDIHHGRLGQVGEHRDYALRLCRRCIAHVEGAFSFRVPSHPDRLILQGLERLYGRAALRLSDLVLTVSLLEQDVDWDVVLAESHATGTTAGLKRYFGFVEQAGRRLLDRSLLPNVPRDIRPTRFSDELHVAGGRLGFPAVRVNTELYGKGVVSSLRDKRWISLARYCLLPIAAAHALTGRVRRYLPRSRGAAN